MASRAVADADPASLRNRHVKLAPSFRRPSGAYSVPEVTPNLSFAGRVTVLWASPSGAPLRYHVTLGDGFPPADWHVSPTCFLCCGPRSDVLVDTLGTPGITTQAYSDYRHVLANVPRSRYNTPGGMDEMERPR